MAPQFGDYGGSYLQTRLALSFEPPPVSNVFFRSHEISSQNFVLYIASSISHKKTSVQQEVVNSMRLPVKTFAAVFVHFKPFEGQV